MLSLMMTATRLVQSTFNKLRAYSTMLIDPNRALNNGAGVNSPFTNPINSLAKTNGHLEGNGALYVDTGIVPNQNTTRKSTIDFKNTNLQLFGCRTGFLQDEFTFGIDGAGKWLFRYGTYQINTVVATTGIHTIEISENGMVLDDVLIYPISGQSIGTPVNSAYILATNGGSPLFISDANIIKEEIVHEGVTHTFDYSNQTPLGLVSFAETTADGYEVITAPNGRQVTAEHSDGVDSYGLFPNVDGLDPTGSESFAYGTVIKTEAIGALQYLYSANNGAYGTTQFALLIQTDGTFASVVKDGAQYNATGVSVALPNTFYKIIFKRKNGRITMKVNNGVGFDLANADALVSTIYKIANARVSSTAPTYSSFYGGYTLLRSFALTNLDEWERNFNDYCEQEFGI